MITWIGKGKNHNYSKADVSVKLVYHHKNRDKKQISFVFRNGCEKKITKTGYIMVGYDENCIYFAQSIDGENGFKMTIGGSKKNSYLKITDNGLSKFEGDYPLIKDIKSGLYIIRKEG